MIIHVVVYSPRWLVNVAQCSDECYNSQLVWHEILLENFVKYHPSVFLSKEPGAVFDIELPNGLSSLQIRPI